MKSTSPTYRPDTLIFLHIPKNAGRTFESILARQYAAEDIYDIYGYGNAIPRAVEKLKSQSDEDKRNIKLIKGHYQFGLHRFLPQESSYITFLRDPIRRVASHYNYVARDTSHPLYKIIQEQKMSLADYVSSGISIELNNGQTRLLSGMNTKYPFGQCQDDLLEVAKDNLHNHFSVTGIVERFDESLSLMSLKHDWRWIYYARKNVSPLSRHDGEIDKNTLKIIEKYNQYDFALYDFAKRELERKMSKAGENHRRQLKKLALQNRLYALYAFLYRVRNRLRK